MKTTRLVLALTALTAVASTCYGGLLVDVRPVSGSGYTINGKNVVFATPGSYTVNYELWVVVTGDDADPTNDGVQTVYGGVKSTPGAATNTNVFTTFSKSQYVDPFNADTANPNVTPQLLGAEGGTTGSLIMRSLSMIVNTPTTNQYKLATLTSQANVVALDGSVFASLNYVKPAVNVGTFTFRIDGSSKNGLAAGAALVSAGAPVNLVAEVPEPAALILLGMGGLGLVCLWRRKRA